MIDRENKNINTIENNNLDIIIPISIELDWPTRERITDDVIEQNQKYGFTRFALACPCGGWRSVGYPPTSYFIKYAELFKNVKNDLLPYGIECGWWITATVKSGASDEFIRMVRADGSETPFSSCPLDPNFRKRFSCDVALFAKIAKPAFIFTEDDYSVNASTFSDGCYCKYHLEEFSRREGKIYTREILTNILSSDTPESTELLKRWRELIKDTLVIFSEAIRGELDKETPEIPMGYMESGASGSEGDCTEAVSRAMAGVNHAPYARIYGTFYHGAVLNDIAAALYHPLYRRQHIKGSFRFYHESDTFPHTRFYTSGAHMRAIMAVVYSYAYDGSIFQTQQLLDNANEETAYGSMFARERKRFNEVYRTAGQCKVNGVQLPHDPFWEKSDAPIWSKCVSYFGIPYTTVESDTAFIDERQARYLDDTVIKKLLSKGLFLDGGAAKWLCKRGYAELLGVSVEDEPAITGMQLYDLGEREVIRDDFVSENAGRNMPSAHMFAAGNGTLLKMNIINSDCEIISDAYTFQKKYLAPAMTRFVNKLGGHIVVMGMTITGNNSQSLFNYRRQKLFQGLLAWCGSNIVWVKNDPKVFTVMNVATDSHKSDFYGMITLINLCEDSLKKVALHFPPIWSSIRKLQFLVLNGEWCDQDYIKTDDGVEIYKELNYLTPLYLRICK